MTDTPSVVYYLLALLLVGSSLIGIRQPIAKTAKMALAWVAIFGALFVLFAFRDELSSVGKRLQAEATGAAIADGEELRVPIAGDGHFWVRAKVNGHEARFLVDSGASITTISSGTAKAAGVRGTARDVIGTANGPAPVTRARADRFEVGHIDRNGLALFINERDQTNVIGMNFLSSLDSWRVEGSYLVLQP